MDVEHIHGGTRDYNPERVVESAKRMGFSDEDADRIEENVRERAWDGITIPELYDIIYEEMAALDTAKATKYRLRESIAHLNPGWHEFERYMGEVLRYDGLDVRWEPDKIIQGACIDHELDLIADEAGKRFLVEIKHHYHYHRMTGLDVPLIQYARLDDIKKGAQEGVKGGMAVDGAWVIVNTKLSQHAKEYASCTDIRLTSWNYPEGDALKDIVDRTGAYPLTIIRVDPAVRKAFGEEDIFTVRSLREMGDATRERLDIDSETIDAIIEDARMLEQDMQNA